MRLSSGETIIHCGRDDDRHIHRVVIMMSKNSAKSLIDWTPVSERIISARYFSNHVKMTLINAYAPTNDASDDVKDQFYQSLTEIVQRTPRHDMLVITGDLNAKVGNNPSQYENVMGRHGLGVMNENGERLCDFCAMNELLITGTLFPHRDIHKATWVSPDGDTKNQIDHVLINKRFRTSVRDTRAYRGPDVASDHFLIISTLKLKLRAAPKAEKPRVRYNTDKLKNTDIKRQFCVELRNRYQTLAEVNGDVDDADNDTIETKKQDNRISILRNR